MKKQPTSRTCFVCGRENDHGLKMTWANHPEQKQVEGKVIVPEHFNGYPGIVHGGIIAAILDETSGRAVMINGNFENLFVTAKLEVTYKRPTPTRTPLTAVGWIVKEGNRSVDVGAELRLPDGTVTATCSSVVVRPPKQISELWEPERRFWKVEE